MAVTIAAHGAQHLRQRLGVVVRQDTRRRQWRRQKPSRFAYVNDRSRSGC